MIIDTQQLLIITRKDNDWVVPGGQCNKKFKTGKDLSIIVRTSSILEEKRGYAPSFQALSSLTEFLEKEI